MAVAVEGVRELALGANPGDSALLAELVSVRVARASSSPVLVAYASSTGCCSAVPVTCDLVAERALISYKAFDAAFTVRRPEVRRTVTSAQLVDRPVAKARLRVGELARGPLEPGRTCVTVLSAPSVVARATSRRVNCPVIVAREGIRELAVISEKGVDTRVAVIAAPFPRVGAHTRQEAIIDNARPRPRTMDARGAHDDVLRVRSGGDRPRCKQEENKMPHFNIR